MAEGRAGWLAGWERFWFGEASLVRLALFRIVLLAAAFDGVWVVRRAIFQHSEGVEEAFARTAWRPIYAFELLGLGPPDLATANALWIAVLVALALGILGLATRVACAAAALLTFYWIGCEYSFGKPHHTCVALVFGLFTLPLAPVGARLSLDSLLRRLRAAHGGGDPLALPERAPWAALPIRLTQVTIALGYFFSGMSKLAISGLAWANGYTLMGIMVEYRSPWSEHFYGSQPLLVLMSIGLLAGQIGFPLVFLGTAWRWIFVPVAVLFHVMAMQTMGTGAFLTLWLALSCFVALERVPEVLGRFVGGGPVWRRALVALAFVALVWGTLTVYGSRKPVWLLWTLAPVGYTLFLAALPRFLPALEVNFDPRSPRARRAAAWLVALDWAHRLQFRARPGAAAPIELLTATGERLAGSRAWRALLVRLPLGFVGLPLVAAAGEPFAGPQPSPGISQPSRTGDER